MARIIVLPTRVAAGRDAPPTERIYMARKTTWVSLRLNPDLHTRITKAAARHEVSTSEYIRQALTEILMQRNEYTLTGPQKGTR